MKKIVTFGENLVRITPDNFLKFSQTNHVHAYYGGDASNVAVGVTALGVPAMHVTKVPDNVIGHKAIEQLRRYGVDTSNILLGGPRMGIYYMEQGYGARPSSIVYDRAGSSFALAKRDEYDWDKILDGSWLFHFTGIAAALGDEVAKTCLDACKAAKKKGVLVSCDLNYRSTLWSKEKAGKTMTEICKYVDICFAQEAEVRDVFGITTGAKGMVTDPANIPEYSKMCDALKERFPFKSVVVTLLDTLDTNNYKMSGLISDEEGVFTSDVFDIHAIDRVGPGDAFVAGLLATRARGGSAQEAIDMALAFSRMKFSTPGDVCLSTWEETRSLAVNGSGDVKR